jgi:hypothetical protein
MAESVLRSSEGRSAVDRPRDRLAAAHAAAAAAGEKRQRSALTNGRRLLAGVDGRNAWVRRCKDIIRAHLVDLGGKDNASVAEHSIIRRCAVLTTELERLEVRFALANEASPEDLDLYQRTANSLRRLLEAVGLQRRPRDVTPDPLSYAREVVGADNESTP